MGDKKYSKVDEYSELIHEDWYMSNNHSFLKITISTKGFGKRENDKPLRYRDIIKVLDNYKNSLRRELECKEVKKK